MLRHHDGTFPGHDGLPLYYQTWQYPGEPQAAVIMVHGLGAHSGLYPTIVDHLAPLGIRIVSFDLRGHGRSPGQRGYIEHWSDFRQDLHCFLHFMKPQLSQLVCFLWGHSLGALIALDYATRHPQSSTAIIASATPIGRVCIAPYKLLIAKFLSQVWPRFSLNSDIKLADLSQDPDSLQARQADPLRHRKGTARFTTEFFKTQARLIEHASELRFPLLMLHGECDAIAECADSQLFFSQVGSPTKKFIQYPGAYHDLHADLCYKTMLKDLEDWIVHQL